MIAFVTTMHRSLRRPIVVLLACALCSPLPGVAQAQGQPQEPTQEPAQEQGTGVSVVGSWEGWAKLANDWGGHPCRYDSDPEAAAVHLGLSGEGGILRGSLAIDIAAAAGSPCPPLRKRYEIAEVTQGPGTVAFTDSGGNEWTLAVRRSATVLQGLMAWREGGPDQPLADGFALADGKRPLARLSGEVRLRRSGEGTGGATPVASAAPAAGETAVSPARKAGAGTALGHLGIVLGANVVGLAALYGVNRLGRGSAQQGTVTCSPRWCVVGAPNAPCFCEGTVLSGIACGVTTTGVAIGEPCDIATDPCQSGLSCNDHVCQDQSGRCPWSRLPPE